MKSKKNLAVPDLRDNSFNCIRIIAAFNVFYGHCNEHLRITRISAVNSVVSLFQGVPIFFILSGFLLWASLSRTDSIRSFIKKRVLRLYPELWFAVIINAVVMIALYREGIRIVPFLLFTLTQASVFQFWTPASLRGYGVGTPNGALWTICPMVQCYLIIWLIYHFLRKRKINVWAFAILISIALNIIFPMLEPLYPNEILYKLSMQTFFPYIWLFLMGAFIYEFYDKLIILLMRYWYLFFVGSAFFCLTGIDFPGAYGTLKCVLLAPAIIGFGYRVNNIKIKHDLSYGFYLFHMVIINAMVQLGIMYTPLLFFVALGFSLLMATISYCTVGAISRNLKKKLI